MSGLHADLRERAIVDVGRLPWTARDGIEEQLLEHAHDRRTTIVRLPPRGVFRAGGDGMLDVFVLAGTLLHERTLPTRTYIRTPANLHLSTHDGCVLFVKQRPSTNPLTVVVEPAQVVFGPDDARGVSSVVAHEDGDGRVVLLRFAPGANVPRHCHDLGEEMFVLEGEVSDEHGRYGVCTWVRQPARSVHAVRSERGCSTFVFADHLPR